MFSKYFSCHAVTGATLFLAWGICDSTESKLTRLIQSMLNARPPSYMYISYINFRVQRFVKQEQLDPVKEEVLQKLGMPMESLDASQVATRMEQ